MICMAIGAASGGTAGGLKVTTLLAASRDGPAHHPAHRPAIVWITIYVSIVAIAMLILLTTESQVFPDRALFEVISATSNVGLSWGPMSPSPIGTCLYSVLMVLGRTLPWIILWHCARRAGDEEALAIG